MATRAQENPGKVLFGQENLLQEQLFSHQSGRPVMIVGYFMSLDLKDPSLSSF